MIEGGTETPAGAEQLQESKRCRPNPPSSLLLAEKMSRSMADQLPKQGSSSEAPEKEAPASRCTSGEPDASDGSLIRRFRRGESDAATALYIRYAQRLGVLANSQVGEDLKSRFDADDVVQSVFRTFFRRVSGGSYDVPDGEELWGLLLVVTLNKTRKLATFHRAGKRDVRSTSGGNEALQGYQGSQKYSLEELRVVIEEFTEGLDPSRRQVLDMRVEGFEVTEIAKRLNKSKRTVERILQELRSLLRDQINEDF